MAASYLFSSFGEEAVTELLTEMTLGLSGYEAERKLIGVTSGVGNTFEGMSHVHTL